MKKINCKFCNSKFIYTLQDGTIVCRHCGKRYKNEKTN
jgi:transcription elongation factor Elf1